MAPDPHRLADMVLAFWLSVCGISIVHVLRYSSISRSHVSYARNSPLAEWPDIEGRRVECSRRPIRGLILVVVRGGSLFPCPILSRSEIPEWN